MAFSNPYSGSGVINQALGGALLSPRPEPVGNCSRPQPEYVKRRSSRSRISSRFVGTNYPIASDREDAPLVDEYSDGSTAYGDHYNGFAGWGAIINPQKGEV